MTEGGPTGPPSALTTILREDLREQKYPHLAAKSRHQ